MDTVKCTQGAKNRLYYFYKGKRISSDKVKALGLPVTNCSPSKNASKSKSVKPKTKSASKSKPKISKVKTPKVKTPQVKISKVKTPQVKTPKARGIPKLSKLDPTAVYHIVKMKRITMPNGDMVDLPIHLVTERYGKDIDTSYKRKIIFKDAAYLGEKLYFVTDEYWDALEKLKEEYPDWTQDQWDSYLNLYQMYIGPYVQNFKFKN